MLYLSPLVFINTLHSSYCEIWPLTLAECALLISSIYYWLDNTNKIKRNIDITVVQISLYTHLYFTYINLSHYSFAFYVLGMISYIFGRLYNSNFAHAFVWIFGSIGNIILTNHICEDL